MATTAQTAAAQADSTASDETTIENIKADVTLDVRGKMCPLPPIKTVRALKRMKPGQVLEVLGTGKMGRRRSPWLAKKFGNRFLGSRDEKDFYRLYILKG